MNKASIIPFKSTEQTCASTAFKSLIVKALNKDRLQTKESVEEKPLIDRGATTLKKSYKLTDVLNL